MKKISKEDLSLDKQVVSALSGTNSPNDGTDNNCNTGNNCNTPTVEGTCQYTVTECLETFLEGCLNQTQEGDDCNDKTKIVECLEHTLKDCPATDSRYILCCDLTNDCNTYGNTCELSECICTETGDPVCVVSNVPGCITPITETQHC